MSVRSLFIVGAPRSGTTLMNLILIASGKFADYRAETLMLSVCRPKYGSLSIDKNLDRFYSDWFRSRQFASSGISEDKFRHISIQHRADWLSLLAAFMNEIASSQRKTWCCDSTPAHVFHLPEILKSIPDAHAVVMVRDPRAVAVSQVRLGWLALPVHRCSREAQLLVAGVQWKRAVLSGLIAEVLYPDRVHRIHYESLATDPFSTLNSLGKALDTDLCSGAFDGMGRFVREIENNTAFGGTKSGVSTESIDRWKRQMTDDERDVVEISADRALLKTLGYAAAPQGRHAHVRALALLADFGISLKELVGQHTPIRRYGTSSLEFNH